jgi:rubredoxin
MRDSGDFGRRAVLRGLAAAVGGALAMRWAARARPARAADERLSQLWICTDIDCSPHIYDPMEGDPEHGIPPGTAFEDLPDGWYCPECGAPKTKFIRYG